MTTGSLVARFKQICRDAVAARALIGKLNAT